MLRSWRVLEMADKFEPNNNILSFSEYMKELEEQKKSLAKSKNGLKEVGITTQ